MTKDEFLELPPLVALGALYDLIPALRGAPKPDYPKPPRYDGRLTRKGGTYVWMSEMTLESLKWWLDKKSESAQSGSEFAERDSKTARNLAAWVAWRSICPTEVWSGTRGEDRATAKPPSRDPALHSWDNSGRSNGSSKGGGSRAGSQRGPAPAQDDEEIDENDIPF